MSDVVVDIQINSILGTEDTGNGILYDCNATPTAFSKGSADMECFQNIRLNALVESGKTYRIYLRYESGDYYLVARNGAVLAVN